MRDLSYSFVLGLRLNPRLVVLLLVVDVCAHDDDCFCTSGAELVPVDSVCPCGATKAFVVDIKHETTIIAMTGSCLVEVAVTDEDRVHLEKIIMLLLLLLLLLWLLLLFVTVNE